MRVLIAGCGYVGTELGLRLARSGDHDVWGLRRDASDLPPEIQPISADLLDPSLAPALPSVDRVVYAAAADAASEPAYRDAYVRGVTNLIAALEQTRAPVERLVFLSSTAVYGDAGGGWVDEATPASPEGFRGRVALDGERLASFAPFPAIVLRLGGIYGPGRTRLIGRVRSGEARCAPGDPTWSNRIHRDDAARAVLHLLAVPDPKPVYLGVDDEPSPICDVYRYVAQLLRVPEPLVGSEARAAGGNKRCSNERLRGEGFLFDYPSYRDGYRAILGASSGEGPQKQERRGGTRGEK